MLEVGGERRPTALPSARNPSRSASAELPHTTGKAAHDAIAEYIEIFYNRIRRHSTIGNVTPATFEETTMVREAEAAQHDGCLLLRDKITLRLHLRRGTTLAVASEPAKLRRKRIEF